MREMQDRFGPPPPRYDMPWPGSGGRSPPPPPPRPVMDMHRSRSKLKKTKKEKGSRHDHDQRDMKLMQKESEKERRTHREKGKLRGDGGEKEVRVKKAPSSGQEDKTALRHATPKEGADWGSSHSPHGKLRKRREEGATLLKDLRAKLTEKPAEVKVMAAAVSVKAPKVESTDKTLPEGDAVVSVKKVRKSKVKAARVKGSKKAKKEAVNGDAQINEKTVKRPASAYPSAGIPDVVSPPKKAKMEADTTCHEDEIPPAAPEGELKVAEVKSEKEEPAPGKEIPQQIGLVVKPPELSKWERDDYDMNDTGVSPRRKPEVKRLPRYMMCYVTYVFLKLGEVAGMFLVLIT